MPVAKDEELKELSLEADKLKVKKQMLKDQTEINELTKKSEEHLVYITSLEKREAFIEKWEQNRESRVKAEVVAYEKLIRETNAKLAEATKLVSILLGYISLGRISEYRDLDRRLNKTDLDTLEGVIQILKEEIE